MTKRIVIKKSNALATSYYNLTLFEHRFLGLCMGGIFHEMLITDKTKCHVSLEQYSELFNITEKEAKSQFKAIQESLPEKTFVFRNDKVEQEEYWIRDIDKLTTDEMYVNFEDLVIENFLGLKGSFITYPIEVIAKLNNSNSIRLYEILKTVAYEQANFRLDITVEELKVMLNLGEKYQDYSCFKRLISKSLAAINEHTDLTAKIIERKKGKKVVILVFQLEMKEN